MLRKIEIEGLRGFAEKTEMVFATPNGHPGSGITVITGPNNSGKSTIIEAIRLRSSTQQSPSFHVGMRNARSEAVSISYYINEKIDTITSLRKRSSETVIEMQENIHPYAVPSRRQFSTAFSKSGAGDRYSYAMQSGTDRKLREQMLTGFEGRLFELERNHTAFDKLLKEIVPDFMSWTIDQNEDRTYFINLNSGGKSHSLSGSGDGVVSVFVIVAALFDSKPNDIIAIDEPELSLHPSIQRRLASVITRLSADRQIIISTHSPYFVDPNALRNGAQILRTWDRSGSIEVCQVSIATCAELKAILSPDANNPHRFGLDAREIFFSYDPILVFEGQEDVVFWPKVVEHKPNLVDIPTYGWGSGGASNVKNVVGVLKALGYKKVIGVLDNDRPFDLAKLRAEFPDFLFIEIPAPDIRTKKAVVPREAVIGLLDPNGSVRSEYSDDLNQRLIEMERFLAN